MNRSQLIERPYAHRGLHDGKTIPENSILAFENAIKNGYSIELDIIPTQDNQFVVFHDENTLRVTGRDFIVRQSTLKDLKTLSLYDTEENIPTLNEVLSYIKGRVPLLIELKAPRIQKGVEKQLIKTLEGYTGPIAIQCFHPHSLFLLKRESDIYPIGLLSSAFEDSTLPVWKKISLRHMLHLPWSRPDFISYEFKNIKDIRLQLMRVSGIIPILAWTIKSYSDLEDVKNYCDNFIFESIIPRY